MSNGTFDLNEILRESREVLVNPKSYFSTMKTSGGITEPLIKAVLYGAIAGTFSFLWSILHIGTAGAGMFGTTVGILSIVWSVVGAVLSLFIGAIILLVISSICKGSTDFESNLRVTAAVMVVMPISAFLGFTGGINVFLGTVVSLAVSVFAFWLLFHGLVEALKTKPETTKVVLLVIIVVVVVFTLVSVRKVNQFRDSLDNSDLKEMMKDMPQN